MSGTTVYAGGAFGTIGGATRNGLAALDAQNTGLATSWNPDVGGQVYSLALSGTTVYAGGGFGHGERRNGEGQRRRLRHDHRNRDELRDGGRRHRVRARACRARASASAASSARQAPAARPTGPVRRSNLAAIDLTTGKATDWNPDTNGTVEVLAVSGSTIYAGGAFDRRERDDARSARGLHRRTAPRRRWNPGVHNGEVLALAVVGSSVYVGGTFSGTTSVSSPAVASATTPRRSQASGRATASAT